MIPLIFNLGPMELVIILVIVLLLFGGSRLAGLGKSTGRALKEFKEETKGLKGEEKADPTAPAQPQPPALTQEPSATSTPWQQPPAGAPTNQPDTEIRKDA